jgi:hypothetical protein
MAVSTADAKRGQGSGGRSRVQRGGGRMEASGHRADGRQVIHRARREGSRRGDARAEREARDHMTRKRTATHGVHASDAAHSDFGKNGTVRVDLHAIALNSTGQTIRAHAILTRDISQRRTGARGKACNSMTRKRAATHGIHTMEVTNRNRNRGEVHAVEREVCGG